MDGIKATPGKIADAVEAKIEKAVDAVERKFDETVEEIKVCMMIRFLSDFVSYIDIRSPFQ